VHDASFITSKNTLDADLDNCGNYVVKSVTDWGYS